METGSRDKDGDFKHTKDMGSKQLLKEQKKMIDTQDVALDQLGGIIQNIKYENQNFNTEVTTQNKMLDSLSVDMDNTHDQMLKVDNKLKHIVANTSQCKLWLIIIAEIFVLLFVLLFF